MIVIRVELWPGGNPDPDLRQDLGTAIIHNDSGLADHSDYRVELLKGAAYSSRPGGVLIELGHDPRPGTLYKSGVVCGYPRKDKPHASWSPSAAPGARSQARSLSDGVM